MTQTLRSLVVEDEFVGRKLLMTILEPLGLCVAAKDAEEALTGVRMAMIEQNPYNLICLDIGLPGMNGNEVLTQIRRIEAEYGIQPGDGAKIIMTTAMEDAKSIMQAFKGQCDGYIVKPITRDKLLDQLRLQKLLAT